jgi:hypothetical protein
MHHGSFWRYLSPRASFLEITSLDIDPHSSQGYWTSRDLSIAFRSSQTERATRTVAFAPSTFASVPDKDQGARVLHKHANCPEANHPEYASRQLPFSSY